MVVRSRPATLFPSDEERGKKSDDHKPGQMAFWNVKGRGGWRKRRVLGALVGCVVVWLFIKNIPTDMGPASRRLPYSPNAPQRAVPNPERRRIWDELEHEQSQDPDRPFHPPKASSPTGGQAPAEEYDGAIKFYHLASTLRAAAANMPFGADSTNVLFAASDMSSAAAIIPIACEMSSWKRNSVHMAIMGKSDLSQEEIHNLNGVSPGTCNIAWHDARPDNAAFSSDRRLAISVAGALGHIEQFIHPVAVVTADLDTEDTFFSLGLQRKVNEQRVTHIQVPKSNPSLLGWLARLDSASLRAWHAASFDVLIQAPLGAAGSLIRLLKSISTADYTGFNPPRLIIELPHHVDAATRKFLDGFSWPPARFQMSAHDERLVYRRRIFEQRMDAAEASLRFIESFYPSSPFSPHVLVLSPQVELSPVYFHYLKLHLLELKHTQYPSQEARDLFGISLEAPSVHLNGTRFELPPDTLHEKDSPLESSANRPFRWQAPNSNAALYFADKWIEAHAFLRLRNTAAWHPSAKAYLEDLAKLVSTHSPSWVEQFLEVMRARGWTLHYPATNHDRMSSDSEALAITHNELYQAPEEFTKADDIAVENGLQSEESVLSVKDDYLAAHHPPSDADQALNVESPLRRSLVSLLPPAPLGQEAESSTEADSPSLDFSWPPRPKGPPPFTQLSAMALLDHFGHETTDDDMSKRAGDFRVGFRRSAGGCSDALALSKEGEQQPLYADDLFCADGSWDSKRTPNAGPEVSLTGQDVSDTAEGVKGAQDAASIIDRIDRIARTGSAEKPGIEDQHDSNSEPHPNTPNTQVEGEEARDGDGSKPKFSVLDPGDIAPPQVAEDGAKDGHAAPDESIPKAFIGKIPIKNEDDKEI